MKFPVQFSRGMVVQCCGVGLLLGVVAGALLTGPSTARRACLPEPVVNPILPPLESGAGTWRKIEVHLINGETLTIRLADFVESEQQLRIWSYNRDLMVVPMREVRFYTAVEQRPEPLPELPAAIDGGEIVGGPGSR